LYFDFLSIAASRPHAANIAVVFNDPSAEGPRISFSCRKTAVPQENLQLWNCAVEAAGCAVNRTHGAGQASKLTIYAAVDPAANAGAGVVNRGRVRCGRECRSIVATEPDRRISQHVDTVVTIGIDRVAGRVGDRVAVHSDARAGVVADQVSHDARRRSPRYEDAVASVVLNRVGVGYSLTGGGDADIGD